jgi:hypothetical protein
VIILTFPYDILCYTCGGFGIPVVVFHPLIPEELLWHGRYCAWAGMFEDRRLGNI